MFLQLKHQELDIYRISKRLVKECYLVTSQLPLHERFGIISQVRRSAVSIHLNLSEGSSRTSPVERKRYFEIARGSLIEIDAAFDIANDLGYLSNINMHQLSELITEC